MKTSVVVEKVRARINTRMDRLSDAQTKFIDRSYGDDFSRYMAACERANKKWNALFDIYKALTDIYSDSICNERRAK